MVEGLKVEVRLPTSSAHGCIRFGVVKVVQLVTPVTRVSEGGGAGRGIGIK